MMVVVPRPSVDEPLVAQRVTDPHECGDVVGKPKLVDHRVLGIDKALDICYSSIKPKNPTRRQAERDSPVKQEVVSLLYGSLADEDLVCLVLDAARAANVQNTKKLIAEFELRLAEYRLFEQYGSPDPEAPEEPHLPANQRR